jgi:hypothetical protein
MGANGNLYVGDQGHGRILEFPAPYGVPNGAFAKFNVPANALIQGVAVDSAGGVYVAYSLSGQYAIEKVLPSSSTGQVDTSWGSSGFVALAQQPRGIAVDSAGDVYVTESNQSGSGVIAKFDGSSGSAGTSWGSSGVLGVSYQPFGIAVDSSGYAFVSDFYGNQIVRYTSAGVFDTSIGSGSSMAHPTALALNHTPPGVGAFGRDTSAGNIWSGFLFAADNTDSSHLTVNEPSGSGAAVTFSGVSGSGYTGFLPVSGSVSWPPNFTVSGGGNLVSSYDITTTVQFNGTIQVTIPFSVPYDASYDPGTNANPNPPFIQHEVSGVWVTPQQHCDFTAGHYPDDYHSTHVPLEGSVTADVTSLSPFALGYTFGSGGGSGSGGSGSGGSGGTAVPASSDWSLALLLALGGATLALEARRRFRRN